MLGIRGFLLIGLTGITAVASEGNEVDLWRYQDGKLVPEELDKIESPGKSCYVIMNRKRGIDVENWTVYYFIPKETIQHKNDFYGVASIAVSIHYKLDLRTIIRREAEGHESLTFKKLFPSLTYKQESEAENMFASWQAKKVFMITQEKDNKPVTVTEIPINVADVFGKSRFCLVCVLDNVYVYYRDDATLQEKLSSSELARILLKRREQKSDNVVMIAPPREIASKGNLGFKEFVTKFQEESETNDSTVDTPYPFTLEEMRRILLQTRFMSDGTETFDIELYELRDRDNQNSDDKKNVALYSYISDLSSSFSYVIDSKSNLGLLVWMGKRSRFASRNRAATEAEYIATYRKDKVPTPVVYINEEDITPELVNYTGSIRNMPLNLLVATVLNKYV